ncbi:MAG: hypothetical protein DI585_04220 [Pseudomonas fluorescens]|nr:MAG: hypothetical protein DI585_04220 [Pseudomonas fluorescens]
MMQASFRKTSMLAILSVPVMLAGCKYYGSALPPEYPMSMEDALSVANSQRGASGGSQRPVVRQPTRPRVERPSYLPEKEMALVTPPKTLLVWTYPHITDDNTRVFGNWSTIFLTDRYEWARPNNELPANEDDAGTAAGRPNLGMAQPDPVQP